MKRNIVRFRREGVDVWVHFYPEFFTVTNMRSEVVLVLMLVITGVCGADAVYPELRDCHDPQLQAALDRALADRPLFWDGVEKRELSVVVADVTDLHHPRVAWYNPDLMLYAASLPKIAIALGAFVEIDRGILAHDDELRTELIRMIRYSSNQDATEVLNKVGIERLAEILQEERYGKLYDPDHGGGLWVGKPYSKAPAWRRDPLHGISHGASAMQAARFYYGVLTGTLIDAKHLALLEEMFGNPGIEHKFVAGLKDRENVEIYRKSGTWRHHHADSGIVVHGEVTYILAAIDEHPQAGREMVKGVRTADDVIMDQARNADGVHQCTSPYE